jgi:TnpA family transposase
MARRALLTPLERAQILGLPEDPDGIAALCRIDETDMSLIRQRRGDGNRLGFAVHLCLLRGLGIALGADTALPAAFIAQLASNLGVRQAAWGEYGTREETRQEHARDARAYLGLTAFGMGDFRNVVQEIESVARQTDRGRVLVETAIASLRRNAVALPAIEVIEKACAEGLTRATRHVHGTLNGPLDDEHRARLDGLLNRRPDSALTQIGWLRQAPARPNARSMLEHVERLTAWRALDLPWPAARLVHRNRLLKLAREGASMTSADLAKFEPRRRYATLFAMAVEGMATVTDEIIDLHDRIIGRLLRAAKNRHDASTLASRTSVTALMRTYSQLGEALLKAHETGEEAFSVIEKVIGWDTLAESTAAAKELAQPAAADSLALVSAQFTTVRRYSPAFLAVLDLHAAPAAADLLAAVDILRQLNATGVRKIPDTAPRSFVRSRWKPLVFTDTGIDRGFYEFCVLTELRNALRSGDLWVRGSRQFRDFDEYLLHPQDYSSLKSAQKLPIVTTDGNPAYLNARLELLTERLAEVERLATDGKLPGVAVTAAGLKITPLETIVPIQAQPLIDAASGMFPRIRITDLLMEVDAWTGFSRHFTNLKTGQPSKDQQLLLTAILADGINLGLTKMSEACPGVSYAKLDRHQAAHIREETYSAALAEIVNTQHRHPFAVHWGDGTSSSSDGQRFRASGRAESTGHVNPKYGNDPGRLVYTHISDQYSPFHSRLVNVGDRDATWVLDGLLYHESELEIREHYTDTAGFTDHLFALMQLLGYRFAPRIRNVGETRLYTPTRAHGLTTLSPLIGGPINTATITQHWDEILRLAASIKTGTVTASLMMRKLGAYPRQNGLATALRELGRIERTLFLLDWLQDPELRRTVTAGLNKAKPETLLPRPCSSTGSAKSGTDPSNNSATAPQG